MISFRRNITVLIGLILLAITATGCDSTETHTTDGPPAVLSPDAFELNTELFSNQNPGSASATKAGEYAHFTYAALRVWPVSLLIKTKLVMPSTLTATALQAEPVLQDGTWVWDSRVNSQDQDLTFRLEGTPDGDSVRWSMFVTAPDADRGRALDNFELYTARTAMDGSSGAWSLYRHLDGERTHVLDADFTVTSDTEKEITFSVPETVEVNVIGSVRYAIDGTQRTFEWTRVGRIGTAEDTFSIVIVATWDAETKAGSIVAPNYNGGEPACWDESFLNVACTG
jgi:hypothetical protein